jgi:autotransporter-associated beta strand protein
MNIIDYKAKQRIFLTSIILTLVAVFGGVSQAGTAFIKSGNNYPLSTNASYTVTTSGIPSITNGDTLTWNTLMNSARTIALGTNMGMAGLILSNNWAVTISASTNTLTLGNAGINMTYATNNLTLSSGLVIASNQNWTVNGGYALIGPSVATNLCSGTGNISMLQAGAGLARVTLSSGNGSWAGYSGNWTVGTNVDCANQGTTNGGWGTGSITLDGGTISEGGTFLAVCPNNISVTANGGTIQNESTSGTRYWIFPGVLTGSGPLAIGGAINSSASWSSGVILSGSNTYSGTITICGAVTQGNFTYTSPGALSIGSVVGLVNGQWSGTTGAASGYAGTNGSIDNVTSIIDNGNFYINRTNGYGYKLPFGLVISGSGNFIVNNNCEATINSTNNTFSGTTAIGAGGTLTVATLNSVSGGARSSSLGAPSNITNGIINIGSLSSLIITGVGEISDRVINLVGASAGSTISQSGTGLEKFTSAFTVTGISNPACVLTLTGSTTGTGEIANTIPDGPSGLGYYTSVLKTGTGTWTLSGANTYSGTTTISNGTLLVTGALGTNSVMAAGGTLGGTGTIGGSVIYNSGANANLYKTAGSPDSPLTISGNLTLNGNTVNVDLGGTTTLSAGSYRLINYAGTLSGSFNATPVILNGSLASGYAATIDVSTPNQVNLIVTVSGPGTFTNTPGITGFKLNGLDVVINGTNGQSGCAYYLLDSTNVAQPLSQWKTVATNVLGANGNFTFTGTNAVNPSYQQQFYILSNTNSNH